MGAKTGRPRGRPPGVRNKRTQERELELKAAAQALSEVLGDECFDGDAHALLMTVYKNKALELPLRVDAAKAAIRYEKPALAAVEVKADVNTTINDVTPDPESEAEWMAKHAG